MGNTPKESKPVHLIWPRLLAAASILLFLGVLLAVYMRKADKQQTAGLKPEQQYIPAGTNKAILTLGNGTKINLDDSKAVLWHSNQAVSYKRAPVVTTQAVS